MEIEEYDRWTINYLRGVGVDGALLERVERLAKENANWKARAKAAEAQLDSNWTRDELGIVRQAGV